MRTGTQETRPTDTAPATTDQPTPSSALPDTAPSPEPREPGGPAEVRVVRHPDAYDLRGMPVLCTGCKARRDWAFINQGRNVWVACRCGHTWHEPEMGRRDIDPLVGSTTVTYPTLRAALTSMGFDGTFRGTYLG